MAQSSSNDAKDFVRRPDDFLNPIKSNIEIAIDEQIRRLLSSYKIPEESINKLLKTKKTFSRFSEDEESRCKISFENFYIYVLNEGSLSLDTKKKIPTSKKDESDEQPIRVKKLQEKEIFFAPSMIIYKLSGVPITNQELHFCYDSRTTEILRYSFHHFKKDYEEDPLKWLPAIKIIVKRTWDAVISPMCDIPTKIERNLSPEMELPEKKFRRNDFLFDAKKKIFKEDSSMIDSRLQDSRIGLNDETNIKEFQPNSVIIEEGSDPYLIFVLEGQINVTKNVILKVENDVVIQEDVAYSRKEKQLYGMFGIFTGENSQFTIKAANSRVKVAMISKRALEDFLQIASQSNGQIRANMDIWLKLALAALTELTLRARTLDFLVDWVRLEPGEALYKKDYPSNEMYIVLDGRLRACCKDNKIKEYQRGNKFGYDQALKKNPTAREETIFAVKPTSVARIQRDVFEYIKQFINDAAGNNYSDFQTERIDMIKKKHSSKTLAERIIHPEYSINIYTIRQLKYKKTITILPASKEVSISSLVWELFILTNAYVQGAFNRKEDLVLRLNNNRFVEEGQEEAWLRYQEDKHFVTLYEGNYDLDEWTTICLKRSDAIIVVENGGTTSKPQETTSEPQDGWLNKIDADRSLKEQFLRTRKELLIIWENPIDNPYLIYKKFKDIWFCDHHHVHETEDMNKIKCIHLDPLNAELDRDNYYANLKRDIEKEPQFLDTNTDLSRIARFITGDALGLTLGGGGAKGAAHIGVIEIMRKSSIPIDITGGTSIGSLVSGILAIERLAITNDLKKVIQDIGSSPSSSRHGQVHLDIWDIPPKGIKTDIGSFPSSSGHADKSVGNYLCECLDKCFDAFDSKYPQLKSIGMLGNLFKRLYSGQLTQSLFSNEYLVEVINNFFEKMHIEEFLRPYFCITTDISNSKLRVHCHGPAWRYIIASMSLPGIFLSVDDENDAYLIDGGCVNNLPADINRKLGAFHVIAIDVGSVPSYVQDYKDRIYQQKQGPINRPNLQDIITAASTLVSSDLIEYIVNQQEYYTYLRPRTENVDINDFDTGDFSKFSEIYTLGKNYGIEIVPKILTNPIIQHIMNPLNAIQEIISSFKTRDRNQNNTHRFREIGEY